MKIVHGTCMSPGKAVGKAYILQTEKISYNATDINEKEKQKILNAIRETVTQIINEINEANEKYDHRIAEIFNAHKYIVDDPVLIEKTIKKIDNGYNAFKAYDESVHEFIKIIEVSDNDYMLGRIIDIIDATDMVKENLCKIEKHENLRFDEPTIIISKEIKPSLMLASKKSNIVGFVSIKGYFHQHSGIIARTLKVPEIISSDILNHINGGENIMIDCDSGNVYIEPTTDIIDKERGRLSEL